MITDQVAEGRASPPRAEEGQSDITEVQSTVADLEERARTFIRQRPVVAVLLAVGVGYLVARVLSRRTT